MTAVTAGQLDHDVVVYVDLSGEFPATGTELTRWLLGALHGDRQVLIANRTSTDPGPIRGVSYNKATLQVEIRIDPAAMGGIDPRKAGWTVVFVEGTRLLTITTAAQDAARFRSAKNKDDADLYVSGGLIAGPATKPIWMIDAKGAIGWPMGANHHWIGVIGSYQVNPDAKPPADSGDANPDAISLYAQMDKLWPIKNGKVLYGVQGYLRPIGGEFSSDPRSGSLMTAAQLSFLSKPMLKNALVVDPFVGYEIGSNKQKPTELFKRQVDLGDYDRIRRLLTGVSARYYVFQQKISADQVYRLVFSVSWTGRYLGTDEPFVRSMFVPNAEGIETRQKVLTLESGSRHFVEVDAMWNVSPLFGFEVKYKRGSQPPLFQYVDSQISFGVSFKTKFGNDVRAR